MEQSNYLSFEKYLQTRRIRLNKRLWDTDPQYKAKMWRPHRVNYYDLCSKKKYFNDFDKINSEVVAYEMRLLDMEYRHGSITDREYVEKESYIKRKI